MCRGGVGLSGPEKAVVPNPPRPLPRPTLPREGDVNCTPSKRAKREGKAVFKTRF